MGVLGHHRVGPVFRGTFRTVLIVGSMLVTNGCQSPPLDAMRGAQFYASGTQSLRAGNSAIAIRDLLRAAELVPHASEIQNHLGLAYWAEGDQEQARLAFDRAIELDCGNTAALENRIALEEEDNRHGG